jgi:hypothetical protein
MLISDAEALDMAKRVRGRGVTGELAIKRRPLPRSSSGSIRTMTGLSWYEVWADESSIPPYLLLLMCLEDACKFQVYDPAERRVISGSDDYEVVRNWLLEDEYTRVNGRMTPE